MNRFLVIAATVFTFSCAPKNESRVLTNADFTAGIEGPAVSASGDLYLVNYKKEGTIGIIPKGFNKASLFCDLPKGSVGNGIRFLNDSVCFIADYVGHNILQLNINTKEIKVFAHNDDMNQPNDLAISRSGKLYASDPNWKDGTGQLWMCDKEGHLMLVDDNCGTTNGVEVSHDEKYLYVNESAQRRIMRYDLDSNGIPTNKGMFFGFSTHGLDGMRCDEKGNLLVARYDAGVIAVFSPNGRLLNEINLNGLKPTNVAFGGDDGRSVFVTMQDKKWVEVFRHTFAGRSFAMQKAK